MKTIRLILGDQLNSQHSWFNKIDEDVTYVLMEIRQETDYVKHHIQKVVGFFLAMRAFKKTLEDAGHQVTYFYINDKDNSQKLTDNLDKVIKEKEAACFEYQLPDEYRLDAMLEKYCKQLSIDFQAYDTEHFYTERHAVANFYAGKKQIVMEYFYRDIRKKHGVLMEDGEPLGGKWNYDKSNQKKWNGKPKVPSQKTFTHDAKAILKEIKEAGIETFGQISDEQFTYPITREEALKQLHYFCERLLPHFGDYQDAMHTSYHALFHSMISFAMNIKLISPKEVIDKVSKHYQQNTSSIDISQVEGFVRQIIGWREFMRGIYWKEMPDYEQLNVLKNKHQLPDFYWTADTKMACLKDAISNSLEHAYAHHIQRLMITGNFALLIQANPDEVDAWYLGVYIDALQWVQLPNTRGMSQWADGGIVATKPYISSGSYIQKMSNYCSSCAYDVKEKTGEKACPFNSLYWNFLAEKREHFEGNNRMAMMLSLLDKMDKTQLKELQKRAQQIIANPDDY